tara:strand:+ start:226 stop:378 length:153 start_codon:yes stop_codon:yes gene_type:complete
MKINETEILFKKIRQAIDEDSVLSELPIGTIIIKTKHFIEGLLNKVEEVA